MPPEPAAPGRGLLLGHAPRFEPGFLHPRHWHLWALLGVSLGLGLVPRAVRDALVDGVGWLHYRLNAKRRRYARINLALCFPELSEAQRERLARRHFQALAGAMLDIPLLGLLSPVRLSRLIELSGAQHLEAARRGQRAVILLTCHSSALDAGVLRLSLQAPIVGPFNPFKSPLADWLMFRLRTRFDVRVARREDGLRPLLRAVREGGVLYYVPDEDLGRERSVFAEFFGQPKASVPVLGRLAHACHATVIPCYTWYDRTRRRYRLQLEPPLVAAWGADREADVRRMNAALEALIALCPEQYMWTLRLFKTRPGGERSPYKAPPRADAAAQRR